MEWVQQDHAQLRLMDDKNSKLRQRLYTKENKKKDKRQTSEARHMTSVKVLDLLAKLDWQSKLKDVFKQAKEIFKEREKKIIQHYKDIADEEKQELARGKRNTAEAKKVAMAAEKQEKKALAEAEKKSKKAVEEVEKRMRKATAEAEKLEAHWLKEMAALGKYALDQAKMRKVAREDPKQKKSVKTVRVQEKRRLREEWREEEAAFRTPSGKARLAMRKRATPMVASTMDLDPESIQQLSQGASTPVAQPRPRPRPKPIKKPQPLTNVAGSDERLVTTDHMVGAQTPTRTPRQTPGPAHQNRTAQNNVQRTPLFAVNAPVTPIRMTHPISSTPGSILKCPVTLQPPTPTGSNQARRGVAFTPSFEDGLSSLPEMPTC